MMKCEYEYDFKFDWILRKARNKELSPEKEDYKKRLMEKIDDKDRSRKRIKKEEGDEDEEAQ